MNTVKLTPEQEARVKEVMDEERRKYEQFARETVAFTVKEIIKDGDSFREVDRAVSVQEAKDCFNEMLRSGGLSVNDWKKPFIVTKIPASVLVRVVNCIEFFQGGRCQVTVMAENENLFRVESKGYCC